MAKFSIEKYAQMNPQERCAFNGELAWRRWCGLRRESQIIGSGVDGWITHLFQAGRGSGKTRTASEWVLHEALMFPGIRAGILAPAFDHGYGVCVAGESGVMASLADQSLAKWHDKKKTLTFANGSVITVYSSEHIRQMRGPQFHRLWIDEPADLTDPTYCWEVVRPAVRLPMPDGSPSQILITGTPKPIPMIQHINKLTQTNPERYVLTVGSLKDNEANLDPAMVEELYERYKGSRYFLQEIEGELLTQAEGALWSNDLLHHCRIEGGMGDTDFDEVAVAIDPAMSTDKRADETGIIVGGRIDGKVYVTHDYSRKVSALQWARDAVMIAESHGARSLVYERNLAGPMIEDVLKKVLKETGSKVKLVAITAKKSKMHRAEPIAALYEAGRVFHVHGSGKASLEKLEAQMTTWEPTEAKSPDRIDACVHLVDHLMKRGRQGRGYRASEVRTWRQ